MSSTTSSSESTTDSDDATEIGLRRSGMFRGGTESSETDDAPTLFEARSRIAVGPEVLADRYESRSILGEGGMGEVRLVWDRVVGREVAMKVLLPSRMSKPRAHQRFLREAHVQGFLDHPGIVPVHEVGALPTGEPYFTMKRVRGVTLHEVLEGVRKNDARLTGRFGRRRRLAAFAKACLAIDYAHVRGVVHRDLKPENMMLGDFGEVYVLDWGVARIVGTQVQRVPLALLGPITRGDHDVLGTPGYMAPEQIDASEDVDQSADVYALGAILFELLTLEPLHDQRSVRDLMISTRDGADARCSVRAPSAGVPVELETLCVRATSRDPLKRPAARELHEAIESFLDGDRETERRRLVSDLHLRAAKENWKRASSEAPSSPGAAQRETIRGLGRALSADPQNDEALSKMLEVLAAPIDVLPADAAATMRAEDEEAARVAARVHRFGRISWLLYVPLLAWLGIRDIGLVALTLGAIVSAALLSWMVDSLRAPAPWMRTGVAMFAMLTMMPMATLFSPVILVPALLAASVPAFIVHLDRRGRMLTILTAVIAAALPLGLEALGVIPPSLVIRDGAIVILPRMTDFPEGPTRIVLALFAFSPLVTSALLMSGVRRELDRARRRAHVHLWRLRQLMPASVDKK
ncbi:MAG: bifunctional serine/threonine protein kinase/MFS transporter [Myxococcota bacterium]|nr:bifunctional serine/threonine protein kinase/MFS transporter [Myxococcota bacterium]